MEKLDKHSEYVAMVKSYGETVLRRLMIDWVVLKLPFFASGPWNWLLVKIATKFAEYAADQAEMKAFFLYVDFRVNGQAKDFEKAMLENRKAQKEGTEQEKKDAEEKLKIALRNLVYIKS